MSASELTIETMLRSHAPRAPQPLRARVLALEPARRPRRRALVVALAALVLAVAAAIVHGVVGSSSTTTTFAPHAVQHLGRVPVSGGYGGAASGSAKATFAPAAPDVTGGVGRLQHTEASLQVRVADTRHLSEATTAATRIATSLGGWAQSVVYRTPAGGGGSAVLELRVPAENVKTAIARLAGLGTLVSQRLSVEDLQHDFEVESAQIAELRRAVAALQKALRDPALPDAQRVLLQIKLAETKRALAQRLHARKGTVAAGTTASISLVLGTEKAIAPVAHHRGRLGRMVHSALGFLGLEGTIALYALIVVMPPALLAAALWALREARRRRIEALVLE
jgi:Domain of unknown function (DUF4349)